MPTILLIEDDIAIEQIYKMKLEMSGYVVSIAHNGLEGLSHLKNNAAPDCVILDLMMPVMNGESFLKKMRKIEKFINTPVVVLTNVSREEAPKTLWHYGITDYFIKAHNTPKDLVAIIDNTLKNIK